jgi:hypothetical protein
MKITFLALCVGSVVAAGAVSPVLAQRMNADDVKWINQCITDNKGQPGATDAIVRKYCMCMNEKMDNNETQSISTWEKSHPTERAACDKESGWK